MQTVINWLKKPYSPDMDVWHWALFVVLILIIASAWGHTIRLLSKAA